MAVAAPVTRFVAPGPIDAVHVGGKGPVVLVVGCIHGNECAALPVVRTLERAHPRAEDLWVVPEANPDGAARDERLNAHGVDLNRNFPTGWRPGPHDGYYPGRRALSEPESRALLKFIRGLHPAVTVWFQVKLEPLATEAPAELGPTASKATPAGGAVAVTTREAVAVWVREPLTPVMVSG